MLTVIASSQDASLFPFSDCTIKGEKASTLAFQELRALHAVNAVILLVLTYTKVREDLTRGKKINNTLEFFVLIVQN